MTGNTTNGVRVNMALEWQRYDACPAQVREVLRNAFFDWKVPVRPTDYASPSAAAHFVDTMIRADIAKSKQHAAAYGDALGWIAAQGSRKRRDWTDQPSRRPSQGARP